MKLTLDLYIISRCTHSYYTRALRKLGISMGQFPFLMEISEQDGISQEKLSKGMKISKSTTAVIVRQLVELGLAVREPDAADRRNFRLHLTAGGWALIPRIQAVIDECHQRITGELSAADRRSFVEMTRRVRNCTERELKV